MLPLNLSNLSRHYAYKHKGIPVPKRVKAYNFTP